MKINCESCNTRYAIPDEKVQGAGRTFKITCRKCGAPILVQGIAGAEAAAESAWYYAVGTERQGPVTTEDLARLVDEGVLNRDSYVWCQGMAAWEHLKSVEALASVAPAAAEPVAAAAYEAPAETPAERATEAEIAAASDAMKTLHELQALSPDALAAPQHAAASAAPEAAADAEDPGSDTTMIPQDQIAAAHAQYASESLFGSGAASASESPFGDDEPAADAADDDAPLFGGLGDADEPADAPLFAMEAAPISRPAAKKSAAPAAKSASKPAAMATKPTASSLFDSPEVVSGAADDDDIFGSDDFGDEDDAPPSSKPTVHGRRETSVLFSLDDIGSSGDQSTHDDSMVTESSGLIDIRAVAARTSAKSTGVSSNPFGDDAAASLVLPGGGGMALASPIVTRRRGGGLKMAMVAVLAVAVGGVLVWWLMSQQKPAPAPEARTVPPAAQPAEVAGAGGVAAAPGAGEGKPAEGKNGEPEAAPAAEVPKEAAPEGGEAKPAGDGTEAPTGVAEAAPEGGEAKPEGGEAAPAEGGTKPEAIAEPAKPKPEVTKPKPEIAKPKVEVAKPETEPEREDKIPVAKPTAGGSSKDVNDLLKQLNEKKKVEEPAEAAGGDSEATGTGLPPKLGAAALKGTLRKRHGSFSACYAAQADRPPGSVTVKTTLVIASSGAVTSARITGGGGTTSAVQSCIVNALLATRFSGFTDPQMIVNYPIVLH